MQQQLTASDHLHHRVLLGESDDAWCSSMSAFLSGYDFFVESIGDGSTAIDSIATLNPEIVLLNTQLPGKDCFEICRELRATGNNVPLMVLASREEAFDHVLGLEMGADDYVAKDLPPRVLLARIKALLRRANRPDAESEDNVLQFGKLKIHGINREVMLGEQRISMTPAEFDLLWLLATNAGTVMHRTDILQSLRGLQLTEGDRSVDARLYRLRRRFGRKSEASWKIKTVRPHGYMFCLEPW
jgi:DNA-binding response OmpR family regulator